MLSFIKVFKKKYDYTGTDTYLNWNISDVIYIPLNTLNYLNHLYYRVSRSSYEDGGD